MLRCIFSIVNLLSGKEQLKVANYASSAGQPDSHQLSSGRYVVFGPPIVI